MWHSWRFGLFCVSLGPGGFKAFPPAPQSKVKVFPRCDPKHVIIGAEAYIGCRNPTWPLALFPGSKIIIEIWISTGSHYLGYLGLGYKSMYAILI